MTHTGYKIPLIFFFITTILSLSAQEQKGEIIMGIQVQKFTKQEKEVQNTITKLFDGISINDAAAIKSYCTKDVNFYEYGQVWPLDTLLQKLSFLPGFSVYNRTNTFDFVSTTVKGNIAWATYYLESIITKIGIPDIKQWMETVILIKEKNQWKISVLHSTRLSKN